MSIGMACHQHWEQRRAARHAELRTEDENKQLERLAGVIDATEAANLSGRKEIPATLRSAVRGAAARIAVKAPRSVWTATSTARLHESLLDWQGRLLDAVRAHRLAYPDRFD